jgi:hypothetical protein
MFSGLVKLKLIEASDLKPTAFQGRLVFNNVAVPDSVINIDPYVSIDLDEVALHR